MNGAGYGGEWRRLNGKERLARMMGWRGCLQVPISDIYIDYLPTGHWTRGTVGGLGPLWAECFDASTLVLYSGHLPRRETAQPES